MLIEARSRWLVWLRLSTRAGTSADNNRRDHTISAKIRMTLQTWQDPASSLKLDWDKSNFELMSVQSVVPIVSFDQPQPRRTHFALSNNPIPPHELDFLASDTTKKLHFEEHLRLCVFQGVDISKLMHNDLAIPNGGEREAGFQIQATWASAKTNVQRISEYSPPPPTPITPAYIVHIHDLESQKRGVLTVGFLCIVASMTTASYPNATTASGNKSNNRRVF